MSLCICLLQRKSRVNAARRNLENAAEARAFVVGQAANESFLNPPHPPINTSLVDEGLPGDLTQSSGYEIGEIPECSSYDRS